MRNVSGLYTYRPSLPCQWLLQSINDITSSVEHTLPTPDPDYTIPRRRVDNAACKVLPISPPAKSCTPVIPR